MTIYLGENIKRLRKERELTQEALANFLGVSYQSISKWERDESFPDITMLPEIAGFFKVSVDELLGVNSSKDEAEIIKELETYDNLSDEKLKQEIIDRLKEKFPNDFRVLLRYMTCLVHFKEKTVENVAKIIAIYENIKQNCSNDKIRISAKRHIAELYRELLLKEGSGITFDDCEKIIKEMPRMRDGQEMFCTFYPLDHPEHDTKIQNAIEESFLLRTTFYSHFYFYNDRCTDEWQIKSVQKEIEYLEFAYDDGNYGKMWRMMMNLYGHLSVKYFNLNDYENAIYNFKKSAGLAIKFDSMERITVMHSTLFEGKKFDKHTLGSTFIAKSRVKELLTKKYPLSDEFKASAEFKEILDMLG